MEKSSKPGIPRVVEGIQVTTLPLGPLEGFVLSRVDGHNTVQDIAEQTGQTVAEASAVVDKLIRLGAVEWTGGQAALSRRARMSADRQRWISDEAHGATTAHTEPPPPPYDPAELEEDVDLPMERRKLILESYSTLEKRDHYQLLGLPRSADRVAIRARYFELSKLFHPDTMFGKKLGTYKSKMEAVFQRITEAYGVLGKKSARREYDEYLGLRDETGAMDRSLEETQAHAEAIERGEVNPTADTVPPPPPEGQASPRPSGKPVAPSAPPPSKETSKALAARRSLHTQRLVAATGHGRPRAASGPRPVAPRPAPAKDPERALQGLTHSLKQAARVTGGPSLLSRHLYAAKEAEATGDLVGAANSLRLALAVAPNEAHVAAEHERVQHVLASRMAETYEKQARYEERTERWAAASLSWSRVSKGRPGSAEAAWRTARAVLAAGGDIKNAKAFAQKAVNLEPTNAHARRELGRVFFQAGMLLNAKRELTAAAELDPSDQIVQDLLRKMK